MTELRPGESIGGLKATIESQRIDIEHLRLLMAGQQREMATYRPDPEVVPAPRYDGHAWMGKYSYTGPYHLVAITMQPYPALVEGVKLPDIAMPAKKGLCGGEWQTAISWPQAVEVCAVCVQRAEEKGLVPHLGVAR